MKTTRLKPVRFALAALAFMASTGAMAAQTWDLSNFDCGVGSSFGNTWSAKSGSGCSGTTEVTASAWANTDSGSTIENAQLNGYSGSGFGIANQIEGIGVSTPNHGLDGSGQTDMILFNFAAMVALDKLGVGWISTDSDLSVLAWTGASPPPLTGKTLGGATGLVTSGWTLVGNYANVGASTTINASNTSSSWWLVSAYNSAWGGGLTSGDDYVKLLTISTKDLQRVPEPGSLALAGLAMFAMLALPRKANNAAA
jgi:hypothetical protein